MSTERDEWVVGCVAASAPWVSAASALLAVAVPPGDPLHPPGEGFVDSELGSGSGGGAAGGGRGGGGAARGAAEGSNGSNDEDDDDEEASDCDGERPDANERRGARRALRPERCAARRCPFFSGRTGRAS